MSRGVRCAETTRTSWGTPKRSSISTAPSMTGRSDELPITTATTGGAHGVTPWGRSSPSGTGVPRAMAADQARDRTTLGLLPAHRHVTQLASGPGRLAVEVDVRTLDGEPPSEQTGRVVACRPAEDVDACHLRVLRGCRAERQVEHGSQVVLELGGHRTLNGPVSRVVGPGRDLVDEQPAPRREELHGHHADRAGDLGDLLAQGRGRLHHVGGPAARGPGPPGRPRRPARSRPLARPPRHPMGCGPP